MTNIKSFLGALLLIVGSHSVCRDELRQEVIGTYNKGVSCTTPTGANFTESFGDSSTLCWTAGPSTCNQTWTIANGSAESIVSSPAGAPANTACANSLQMAMGSGQADITSTNFTGIASSTNYDATFTLYVVSTSISLGSSEEIACWTTSGGVCDSSGAILEVLLGNSGGTLVIKGNGSTTSATISISTGSWFTVVMHHDATAANCSIAVNGGTAQTFTCNTATTGKVAMGSTNSFGQTVTYDVGNVKF